MPPRRRYSHKIGRAFVKALREIYRSHPDPYDPDHLWRVFQMYFNFLRVYADPRLTEVTPDQWRAYEISVKEPESADWRTRRGGKSMALAVLGVFFSLIRFGRYNGFGIYRAPYANQLKQFEKWLRMIPFVTNISRQKSQVEILDSEGIDYAQISESTTASLGASFALLDEEKKIEKGYKLYDLAVELRGILVEGDPREKRIIHKSTGGALTYWEDIIEMLERRQDETGRQCIIRIPWQKCPWITEESIRQEAELNYNAPWYVDQEYNCLNIPRFGYFFDQSKLHIVEDERLFRAHPPDRAGVDFNGPIVGHIVILARLEGETLYLHDELVFRDVDVLKRYMDEHPEISFEVEGTANGGGGYNSGYDSWLVRLGARCRYNFWENNTKHRRLSLLQRCEIYVSPKCKWFIRNFKEATFDDTVVSDIRLKKTKSQHGLDACLHALHEKGGRIHVETADTLRRSQNIFGNYY